MYDLVTTPDRGSGQGSGTGGIDFCKLIDSQPTLFFIGIIDSGPDQTAAYPEQVGVGLVALDKPQCPVAGALPATSPSPTRPGPTASGSR
jgi:hypothetical protein